MEIRRNEDYSVAWVCALTEELIAATCALDDEYGPAEYLTGDTNTYTLGCIGGHNVVICSLPKSVNGTIAASSAVVNLLRTFPNIRFGLLVGIGGGVPSIRHDISLGDVVVSSPGNGFRGVLQHDHGKWLEDQGFKLTGSLNKPPILILSAVSTLEAGHWVKGNGIKRFIESMVTKYPRLRQQYFPDEESSGAAGDPKERAALPRPRPEPEIHYGLIASGSSLIKNRHIRDELGEKFDVLCVEMEAAGVMDNLPCLVIRGISDFADPFKNDQWKGYAAAAAAGYAKELLYTVPKEGVKRLSTAGP
ncbi:nucleoside phosphorylase domain-containing protein [Aspergillus cavernicola]|uniref:Nucleoside phosphorylase domain-containing protein n=1 Tax=Aspergillus cavernicola TaxID=176166 RepID=A0ABR4I9H8_9EURO